MRTPADPLDRIQALIDAALDALRPPATRNIVLVLILGTVVFATRAALFAPLTVGRGAAGAVVEKEKQLDDVWRDTVELQHAAQFFRNEGKQFAREAVYQRLGEGEVLVKVDPSEPEPEATANARKGDWVRERERRTLKRSEDRKQLVDHWVHANPIPEEKETEPPEDITTSISEDRLQELIDRALEANKAAQAPQKDKKQAGKKQAGKKQAGKKQAGKKQAGK
jgi:hypothetical protein